MIFDLWKMEANIVVFILLSILCQAKTAEVDQEDFNEDLYQEIRMKKITWTMKL